nr:hypothetical protein [Methanocalculus chunghsingensis]
MSDDQKPVGMMMDISIIEEIEAVTEDFGLAEYIRKSDDDDPLGHSKPLKSYRNGKESQERRW